MNSSVSSTQRWYARSRFVWGAVVVGVVARLVAYVANRSLWMDEASLAVYMLERDLLGLLQPLPENVSAPAGFLWCTRSVTYLFGESERALRAVPLLAGVALLPVMVALARRALRPAGVSMAVVLCAASGPLAYFATEFKPYIVDALLAATIPWLVLRWLERPAVGRTVHVALAGVLGVWMSYPSLFVLTGAGLVIVDVTVRCRCWARGAAIVGSWVVSAAMAFPIVYAPAAGNRGLHHYWSEGFAPLPISPSAVQWYLAQPVELLQYPVGMTFPGLAALVLLVGVGSLWTRGRHVLMLVGLPVVLVYVASLLGRYPLSDRLLLFAVPGCYLLMGEGVAALSEPLARRSRAWVVLLVGLLLVHPLAATAYRLAQPREREELRPVLAYVAEHRRPGDWLYVYSPARFAFRYYAPRLGLEEASVHIGASAAGNRDAYRADVAALDAHARVWAIFAHGRVRCGIDEQAFLLHSLERTRARVDRVEATGAGAYLFVNSATVEE